MISLAALKKELGVTSRTVQDWIDAGLPHTGKGPRQKFDTGKITDWLLATGRASDSRIVTNISDVANHFGVSARTVSTWIVRDGFPGRSGTPGRQDGYFPLEEIDVWRKRELVSTAQASEINDDLKRERLWKLQLENAETESRLIDRDAVEQWVARKCALARQKLMQIEPTILSAIPLETDHRVKMTLAADIRRMIDQTLSELGKVYDSDSEAEE